MEKCPVCDGAGEYPEGPQCGLQTCDECDGSCTVTAERRGEIMAEHRDDELQGGG